MTMNAAESSAKHKAIEETLRKTKTYKIQFIFIIEFIFTAQESKRQILI